MALDWTIKGQELEEYLSTLTISDLKRIIKDFSLYAEKEKKDYVEAKLHYEEKKSGLDDYYKKRLDDCSKGIKELLKRESLAFKKAEFWECKFRTVKQENNKLRNKLYKKENG